MAVQDTSPGVGAMARLDRGQASVQSARPAAKPVRRLPVQKDWRAWALISAQIAILVGGLSLWEIGARAGWIDAFFWSQPSAIARTMAIFFATGDAWTDISFTFRSTIFGFLIGTTAGSLLGLSFWWSRNYAAIVQPYVICLESIPKLALAPLIILVFGIGLLSKVAVATALTLVVSTLTAYAGVKALDPDEEKLFYSLGASRMQVFRKLVVPFCMPWVISVLRVNIGLALTGAIVGEFIASQHGLGRTILYAGQTYDIALVWVAVLVLSTVTLGGSLGLTLAAPALIARAATKELLVAEPVHGTGYLPMYIAMANGYFAESDIVVNIVTIETGGGHTNAVLSGQAFAFIGGPEHNAFAKAKGAELRAVVHCVDRGNVYFCAATGQEPKDKDWPSYFKGKSIALSPYGGTPNSILRYLLAKWKLDAKTDVTLQEVPNSAVPVTVKAGKATIGVSTEPMITQGIKQGFWSEPFFNIPKELGPYAYSTINIRQDSIAKEPEVVRGFVRGMMKALKFLYANPGESAEIAKRQFPTMPLDDLKATLDRSFADEMWSKDGMISRAAWDTGKAVVMGANILKTDVKYEEIIDMSFVESVRASL